MNAPEQLAKIYISDCKSMGHRINKSKWCRSHNYTTATLNKGLKSLGVKDISIGGSRNILRDEYGKFASKLKTTQEHMETQEHKQTQAQTPHRKEPNYRNDGELLPYIRSIAGKFVSNLKTTQEQTPHRKIKEPNYRNDDELLPYIRNIAVNYGKIDNQSIFFRGIAKNRQKTSRGYSIGKFTIQQNGTIITNHKGKEEILGDIEKVATDQIIFSSVLELF